MQVPTPSTSAIWICDIQSRFATAIHQFDAVTSTARKLIIFAQLLNIPVLATEQKPQALGSTVADIGLDTLPVALRWGTFPKTRFSMLVPDVVAVLNQHPTVRHIILVGIEAHVCVLQTALDLRSNGYFVHVLADGVSSCNPQEVPIALATMRQAGAQVTTSESVAFQLVGDASIPTFKSFSAAVKDEKDATQVALRALL
ncbi:Isochorismatase hydrolase [Auriculariales sp. MPI-PUGE-AT-0066]|nr:Isochorismatase hydrolase [Auriculariales sp. MPI-PUGE-AT-0066]